MNALIVKEENKEKIQLIKDYCCRGLTDLEMQLFLYTCNKLSLDPMARQIHAVKRWNSDLKREALTIQVGIDGYRLIADRTNCYSPGRSEEFRYDENGKLVSATAFIMKMTRDGRWHEISATAYYSEYAALKKDGTINHMWASKPHIMLGKCAEAIALRKAFPAELSGVYTKEEMQQAENDGTLNDLMQQVENNNEENKKVLCDEFLEKWSKVYNKEHLLEYIEKRGKFTKETFENTVILLSSNEKLFEEEFGKWHNKHKNQAI